MLRSLHMKDVGPAERFDLELGERLNVLTGDNGLGKSFVLEVAWWALTGTWIGKPVLPAKGKEDGAEISGERLGLEGRSYGIRASYRRMSQDWGSPYGDDGWPDTRMPVLHVTVEGGFVVWDPARAWLPGVPGTYQFDQDKLWNGVPGKDKPITNGLIQDWAVWWLKAAAGKHSPFELFVKVLKDLSHPGEEMRPAEPRRIYLDDPRDYPTVDLPYDNVPIVHLSAGMRRVLSLAYLIVWTWTEHEKACELLGWKPADQIVFLMDEVESHLHPKWQRHIAPALLHVLEGLGAGSKPQVLLTTHSPLVLASLEPHFDEARDKLFLFELSAKDVTLREVPWAKRGDAVSWLTSPVFGLTQARSSEAERAIDAAYDFMAGRGAELPEGLQTADQIERELRRLLPDQDKFWPRWVVHRERKSA